MMKCQACGESIKERGIDCDWRQGRCPHREPMLTLHKLRYFNLSNLFRKIFNRG
jgi:hypothetical protein